MRRGDLVEAGGTDAAPDARVPMRVAFGTSIGKRGASRVDRAEGSVDSECMETGKPSRTALRVAMRRAAHQVMDNPQVLEDPVAIPLLGARFALDVEKEREPFARAFRAFMAARSRYAEDRLAEAVARGVRQYVVLGAGLDTFAYRNPFAELRVFEVDHPATQAWKRELLAEARIVLPEGLRFAPVDFEQMRLGKGLAAAGFEASEPAFFGWLGVVPYLTREAFLATVAEIARLPEGSGVSFDYGMDPAMLSFSRRIAMKMLAARVARAGEPFRLYFRPEELDGELRLAGFGRVEQWGSEELNAAYFRDRADGLRLPEGGPGMLATAWV
jgi:methyltransferase (TIGR00027 family)